jgi:RNA-directed DNA polymerase
VLEPIFEVDFYASSYGYRPGRRAQDAIAEIVHFANPTSSYEWVIEADVEACFDRLDHRVIMTEVGRRIGDCRVLALLRAFLRAGVLTEAVNSNGDSPARHKEASRPPCWPTWP